MSVLELILEDDAGVKQASEIFKKNDLVHWKLDTSVHYAVSPFLETNLFCAAGILEPILGLHCPSGKRISK
jgi:hypothetical protein